MQVRLSETEIEMGNAMESRLVRVSERHAYVIAVLRLRCGVYTTALTKRHFQNGIFKTASTQ